MTELCVDTQLLAAFAERKLKRSEMSEVLAHLETCPTCMSALNAAMDLMEPRRQSRPWMAIAAAIVVLLGIAPLTYRLLRSNGTDRLVRLAPKSARVVEARLSGGFEYAPYRGPMRSTGEDSEAQRMKLVGAAGDLVERADAENSAEAQHAAGIGLVLVERPEDAMARLRSAAERSPANARAWNDLAAAEYMAALRLGRASLYPVALAHADRSLRVDADFAEALFNRALILERLGLVQIARDAWNRYLQTDSSSPWANEAREHRKRLPTSTGESEFKHDQPRLESAAARGDSAAVDAFVDRYRQQSRTWGEAEYLGRWAEAVQRGEDVEGERPLAIARAIGDSLVRLSGESLLRDAVATIDRATPAQRTTMADAHATYRRGRITYSHREPAAAEPDLRRAAVLFEEARSPMALVARYYAANTRFDQDDAFTARIELDALLAETRYAALGAQIRWERSLCAIVLDDWTAAAALAEEAEHAFRHLGEASNLAFMQAIRATALVSLGRLDDGWALRLESFAIQSGEGRGNRLPMSLGDAARIELRTGRVESARALLALETGLNRGLGDDVELSNALVREALTESTFGDTGLASLGAREAMTVAVRVRDPGLRARAIADANFAAGAVALAGDPRQARELLTRAIEHYRATSNAFYIPEAHLQRARASLRLGDDNDALANLQDGIAAIEKHRSLLAGPVMGTGVIDARRELFEEIIAFRLERGDVSGAFIDAERSRRLSWTTEDRSSTIAALQRKLAGSDAAILEFVVLPNEIAAFCVTADAVAVSRRPTDDRAIASLDERKLYDLLIRPSEHSLAGARQLIVVADTTLRDVPFAGLFDTSTNRYLVERMSVAMAPSARTLERARSRTATPSAVAIALPSGEDNRTVSLAGGSAELSDVVRLYAHSVEIDEDRASLAALVATATGAGVIHIAGHTERQPGVGDAALLFRGRGRETDAVTWSRVAAMKLEGPVVILAACETLRAPLASQSYAMSLGDGFLAAGAVAVIGTLTPVADNDARNFFESVHRDLARGRSAPAALRSAQIAAIAARAPGWRSVAVLTNRIDGG